MSSLLKVQALDSTFKKFCGKYCKYATDKYIFDNKTNLVVEKQIVNDLKMSQSNKKKFQLKTPKGTRDFHPYQMSIKEQVFNKIIAVFKRHGAGTIETPVFELKEILTGKYGEDSKLIYNLEDQGGELLSLRYDLTVPFARYLAMNKITNIKRYQIAKVYRRDNTSVVRGRYREFHQCDFDIAGIYDLMIPDVECVRIIYEILQVLNIGDYIVKVNHRQLLDGILENCGVPKEKFRAISSSIDKLDKENWETVKKEMIDEKGVTEDAAEKISLFVTKKGSFNEIIANLEENVDLCSIKSVAVGLSEMKLFAKYAELNGIGDKLIFDLSLARGLDYYTGIIFETVLLVDDFMKTINGKDEDECCQLGSIAAGGRYDNLVGMFDEKNKLVPCVGLSIGVERIFSVIEAMYSLKPDPLLNPAAIRTTDTEIYVISVHKNLVDERMKLCAMLWDNNFNVEHSYKNNPKILPQLQYCEKCKIPVALIIGQDELEKGVVKLRDVDERSEFIIKRDDLIKELNMRFKK